MKTFLLIALAATVVQAQATPTVLITDRALDGRGAVLRGNRITVENGKISSLSNSVPGNVGLSAC